MKNLQSIIALAALSVAGVASAQGIRTTVDGGLVNFPDVQPRMVNGRVMVPVRGVFEHMNATVDWDNQARVVNAQRGDDTIRLPINSYTATVNGREVSLDTPATFYRGRTMVPLRFLSESMRAGVEWIAATRTVEVTTAVANYTPPTSTETVLARIEPGTVTPFLLNTKLSSNGSRVGDRFTAVLDTAGNDDYVRLPSGTKLEGSVSVATPKKGETPGVLGLEFDRVVLPNGKGYPIYGVLHGLDANSVTNDNGRLTAKPASKKNDLKYVGYGAGAGALVSILTKGNLITNTVIGAALGYLYGEIQKDPSKSRDVTLDQGSRFGVRLTNDLAFRIPATSLK